MEDTRSIDSYSEVKQIVSAAKALDPMIKYSVRHAVDHYDLYINRYKIMCLDEYNEIVSKSRPETYEQVLIGEVLALLDIVGPQESPPCLRFLSEKVYRDLRSTFKRSRREGEAKALVLAKKLRLDDFNLSLQTRAWLKIGSPPRILELKITNDREDSYAYSLRFSDGVDSITVECNYPTLIELFSVFWYFKTRRFKQLISLLSNSWRLGFRSSIQGVKGETLLKTLKLALRYNTTLGAALFLTARD